MLCSAREGLSCFCFFLFLRNKKNQRTDSPKSLLACKVLMECCVSSMQFYIIHAKKIDDIPMLPILYDKMELYGIYQASGHCTSGIEDFL